MGKTKTSNIDKQNVTAAESELNTDSSHSASAAESSVGTTAIRICHSTRAELERVLAEVERNGGKKKIKADTVIRFALAKLKEQDFEELRAKTVSYSELFDREFLRYKLEESDVNRDEFLGLVLLGKPYGRLCYWRLMNDSIS
ncbi:MAG: hypothetical protein NTV34_04810 [Proteobacteria bacterium]|nr:hypothetical protein [Pseudomonadota bacterium]